MSRFHHPNVVKLIGVSIKYATLCTCSYGDDRYLIHSVSRQVPYLIISEYMNKGDLKKLLRGDRKDRRYWPLKMKLTCALQVAKGLKYLVIDKR